MKKLKFAIALFIICTMAVPAFAALTVDKWTTVSLGNKRMKIAQVDFDSSYAFGGESFDYTAYGFVSVDSIRIAGQNGVTFDYDYTNKKIKAFTKAPPVVFEETVMLSSGAGTLTYPASFIMYVSANSIPYKVIPGGLTPAAEQVSVSEPVWGTRNTLTFSATDQANGKIKGKCVVTYATQAWKEIFDNYVLATLADGVRTAGHADLAFHAGTPDRVHLGELAIAIQSVMWDDDATYKALKPVNPGETPATTEFAVDWSEGAAADAETKISFLQTDAVDDTDDTLYIQYIKKPASGSSAGGNTFVSDRFVDYMYIPASGTTASMASAAAANAINTEMLLFGTAGAIPGPTGFYSNLLSISESPSGANEIHLTTFNAKPNVFMFGQSGPAARSYINPAYIFGKPYEINNLVPLEVPNGADLSDLTNIRIEIIGW